MKLPKWLRSIFNGLARTFHFIGTIIMGIGAVAAILGLVGLIFTIIYMIFWGPSESFLGRRVIGGVPAGNVETYYRADWSRMPRWSLYPLFGGMLTMIPGMICISISNFFHWIIGEKTDPIFD